jgi:glycosyltransferase involved in cell wall biosynthesis
MSKLAIDLTYQPTGGSITQILEIIKNVDSYVFDEVNFYITNDNLNLFEGSVNKKIILKHLPFSKNSIIIRTIWAQFILPISLVLNHVDVLFCPGNISPILNTRKKVQWIGTIGPFEKNFISTFGWKQQIKLLVTKYLMIFSSITSDVVIFESQYTRDLFVSKYKQILNKTSVLHIGHDEFFQPVDTSYSNVANLYRDKEFILTVSHLYPYKNIELLIKSYYSLLLHKRDCYVLIAGRLADKSYYNRLKSEVKKYGLENYFIFLGSVRKQDLKELYSRCKMFVFTSPFENFAYTLVEAMSCSSPIITTNTTAMPETCGDAALYFSPDSEQELSNCILTYMNNEDIRLIYKEKSLLKSAGYEIYSEINRKTNILLKTLV